MHYHKKNKLWHMTNEDLHGYHSDRRATYVHIEHVHLTSVSKQAHSEQWKLNMMLIMFIVVNDIALFCLIRTLYSLNGSASMCCTMSCAHIHPCHVPTIQRQRTVYRLTLVKAWNVEEMQAYSELIALGQPDFIEVKVGLSNFLSFQYNKCILYL